MLGQQLGERGERVGEVDQDLLLEVARVVGDHQAVAV